MQSSFFGSRRSWRSFAYFICHLEIVIDKTPPTDEEGSLAFSFLARSLHSPERTQRSPLSINGGLPCKSTFTLSGFSIFLPELSQQLSHMIQFENPIHFSHSVCLDLQPNVGSLSGTRSMYRIGAQSPTYSSVKLRIFPSPSSLSFFSGPLCISPLTYSSSNPSRRRAGLLSSVRASAEVRVCFLSQFLLLSPIGCLEYEEIKDFGRQEIKG